MKILNVNLYIDSVTGGGTAERTFQMSKFLSQKGYDCTILTFVTDLSAEKKNELKDIHLVMLSYWPTRFFVPRGGLKIIRELVKTTDIIHLMNHWTLLNALVYFYAKYFRKPYVVCPAGSLKIMGRSKIIKGIFNFFVGNKIIKNANGHIAIAENEFEEYQSYGIGKPKVTLIPNGIDNHQKINSTFNEKLDFSSPFILFLGRLNRIKGPDILLDAYLELEKKYHQYHLVFAGPDDGMLNSLKNKVLSQSLCNKVHFMGIVSGDKKKYLYQESSFLVIPSRKEAMSIVLLESGIHGKPALITDQCGFNQLEEIHGGVVVPATKDGIKKGLIKMFSEANKEEMGNNLKNYILKDYTWESVGGKIITLYNNILKKQPTELD